MKYCSLGGILQARQYIVQIEENALKDIQLGSKNMKHLRGSTQVTILPLAIMLTVALSST